MLAALLKRPDSRATSLALLSATIIIAHQVAGKATRDALFLSHFEVTQLPKVVIASAIASMLGVLVMSWLLPRFGPSKLVPGTFALSAVLFAGEWLLFGLAPAVAAVVLYLHMAVFGAILISGFWSVVNERFDPHSAKQTVARIAAAAALGGVLGGVVADRVVALGDLRSMLLVLSALHAMCVFSVAAVGRTVTMGSGAALEAVGSGLAVLRSSRYLQQMALLMILVAVMAALVDYALKAEAKAAFPTSESLVTFFATFYAVAGVAGFVLQVALGPKMLERFGIGSTIAVLPGLIVVLGVASALVSFLWSVVVLRGAQAIFAHSFYRSAFELLYTPLPPHQKRPTKAIIDVASDRLGDVLGAGLILLLLTLLPVLPTPVVTLLAAAAAGAALYVVRRLYRGYVGQLANNLSRGAVTLAADEVVDATTRHILTETSTYTERELLTARIRELAQTRAGGAPQRKGDKEPAAEAMPEALVRSMAAEAPGALAGSQPSSPKSTRFARAVADLTADDRALVQRALRSDFMDIRLVPYLIFLLSRDEVADDVRMELRWLVPRILGQLTDALLDPDLPLSARQRIPGVLEACFNPRAVDGLLQGLGDSEFNIRYACARALYRMRGRDRTLRLPRAAVHAAIKQELDVDRDVWKGRRLADGAGRLGDGESSSGGARPDVSLEHVFTMLALVGNRDALQIALHAVASRDRNLRGTALEYLENVLPDDIREDLWHHLGVTRRRRKKRSQQEIMRDLRRTTAG